MARYNKKPGLSTKGKSMGGSMGGTMETTKGYQKRRRDAKKAEEARWASLAGPVVVTKIDTEFGAL